jgi:hypothetical protein
MNCDRGFFAKLQRLERCLCRGSEGSWHIGRGSRAAHFTCGRSVLDPDHDAVMRIDVGLEPTGLTRGEAPGGGPILSVGISASSNHGFPPPRIVNSAVRRQASASAE